jgi:hypothetical protein
MSTQERLDKIENLLVSAGGTGRVFNLMQFNNKSQQLEQILDLLGTALLEVLALKKELGCTSTLIVVEPE